MMFHFYVNVGIIVFWFVALLVAFQERSKIKEFLGLGIFLFAYMLLQFNILGSPAVMIALAVVTFIGLIVGTPLRSYDLKRYNKVNNHWDDKSKSF